MPKYFAWVLLGILLTVQAPLEAAEPIGTAERVSDKASAETAGQRRVLVQDSPVFLGDVVETDPQGGVQIKFADETIFIVGAGSRFTLDEYVYDPESGDGKFIAQFTEGVFRLIAGKISLKETNKVEVKLPIGSMGVRGTTVAGEVHGNRSLVVGNIPIRSYRRR